MDEIGKYFASAGMMGLAGFLVVLSLILGIPAGNLADFWPIFAISFALGGFGGFIFYLRHVSVKSQTRVQRATITRVVREVPKPKPKPEAPAEEIAPKRPEIICDTCQFFDIYHPRQKCKYISDKDREDMINAGLECVEYKIKLSLLD